MRRCVALAFDGGSSRLSTLFSCSLPPSSPLASRGEDRLVARGRKKAGEKGIKRHLDAPFRLLTFTHARGDSCAVLVVVQRGECFFDVSLLPSTVD